MLCTLCYAVLCCAWTIDTFDYHYHSMIIEPILFSLSTERPPLSLRPSLPLLHLVHSPLHASVALEATARPLPRRAAPTSTGGGGSGGGGGGGMVTSCSILISVPPRPTVVLPPHGFSVVVSHLTSFAMSITCPLLFAIEMFATVKEPFVNSLHCATP